MIIYKVTNITNNKAYIGQTIYSIEKRKAQHIANTKAGRCNCYFYKALRKYSENNFTWEIVTTCNTKKELNTLEIYYIEYFDTYNNGYNLTIGGNGNTGLKMSKETKQKMSDAGKGRTVSSETKQKLSAIRKGKDNPMYGKHHTPETKQQMSIKRKGENNPMYGKQLSEETKQKISNTKKEKHLHLSKETKQKISKRMKGKNHPFYGKKHSKNSRQKMSNKMKGRVSPRKGVKLSKETKHRLSEANKGKKSPKARAVVANGIHYHTVTDAAKALKVSISTIIYKIRKGKPNYNYCDNK